VARALVAGATAVAETEVERAVGAEGELPAVVVRLGLVECEQRPARGGIDRASAAGGRGERELVDRRVAIGVGVVDDEAIAVWGERDPEEALLATGIEARKSR
jgi:hypothetical protein